jgi:3-oxoacyl-[acyl-carrier protein] reductase
MEEMSGAVEVLLDQVGQETEPKALFGSSNLRGQVAIVTGGSSGIGRAISMELGRCGADIAFCFLDSGSDARSDAQEVASRLRDLDVNVFLRSCDVRDSEEVDTFVEEAQKALGGVQILINNAGIGADAPVWKMEDDAWEVVVRTNLDGAFYFTRAVAPFMRAQEHGKIVNITSVHGIRSEFGISNYASSKAGLIGLTRSTAVELGRKNINVNAVAPGYIRTTRLTDGVPPEILDQARERASLGRLGDPQDVAGVVLFLCSEPARHITGAVIPVDGGYLL